MKQVRRYIAYLFAPAMLVLALVMPASATTTLQLENGNTLSFADGSIDLGTGSGELFDIALSEDGVVVLTAEYLFIDASGSFGETDWYVHDLVVKQAELAEENIFIGEMEIRDIAMGMLVTNAVAEMQDYVTSDSFVLLRNVGMTTDEALISIA